MNALADKYRIAYEEEQLLCALKCKSLQEQLAAARAEVKRMRGALERIATCTVTRSFRDTAIAALRPAPEKCKKCDTMQQTPADCDLCNGKPETEKE